MYSKKDLAERFARNGTPLTTNTVRETLKACGLSTTAQTYTEDEVSARFAVARQMIEEEGKTYADVAAHFMPDARAAQQPNGKASSSTDGFAANQATEATSGFDEIAFKTADKIATPYAQKIAEIVPALTMYRLNEMVADGKMEAGFEKIWDSMDVNLGNSQSLLMQGIERERELKSLPPTTQDLQKLPPESTELFDS